MAVLVVSWPAMRNVAISGSNTGYEEERRERGENPYAREYPSHSCDPRLEGWPGLTKSRDPSQLDLIFP